MPSQLDIHLGLTPSPADEDEVDVLALDLVRRKRWKSVVVETKRS